MIPIFLLPTLRSLIPPLLAISDKVLLPAVASHWPGKKLQVCYTLNIITHMCLHFHSYTSQSSFLCFPFLSPPGFLPSTSLNMICMLSWEATQCCYLKPNVSLYFFSHVLCHFNMGSCLDLLATFPAPLHSSQGGKPYPKCVPSFCKPY